MADEQMADERYVTVRKGAAMSDYNIFGQPVILSSSKPNWADLAIERAAEIERLRAALREIRALHQPEWASEQARAAGKEPWVCALCGTADGLWPCATVATIREVLGDE